MKNSIKISALSLLMFSGAVAYSQSDSLGLPGDNLDLNAVLSIFKQSSTVEDFEKRLNSADTKINNLDLNNDQQVDYLRVVDYGKDNFHSIVIQDPVSKGESQDVAVIEIEKKDNQTAHIQIVGDETLYGKNYIIEPTTEAQAKSSSNNSNSDDAYNTNTNSNGQSSSQITVVNVWGWPSVGYLYSPGYSYWVSPWYWGYYPGWYSPWRPYGGWYAYHRGFIGFNYGFYGYRTGVYAFPRAHNYYYGHRMSSGYVQKTASNYGRRDVNGGFNRGNRAGSQQRSAGRSENRNSGSNRPVSTDHRARNSGGDQMRAGNQQRQFNTNRGGGGNTGRAQNGGQRASESPRMNPGGGGRGGNAGAHVNPGGGGRMNPGGGGGGGHMGGGGGHMGGGGGRGGGGHR